MNLNEIKKIDWQRIEDNRKISLFPVMVPGWTDIINGSKKVIGIKQDYILSAHIGRNSTFYGSHQEWDKIGRFILKRILDNPAWGFKVNREIISRSHQLVAFSQQFIKTDLKKKSFRELVDDYEHYEKLHGYLYHYAIIPVFLDLYQPLLSDYLMDYLNHQALPVFNASEVFGTLTTPSKPSQVQTEELALMKIAKRIKSNPAARKLFQKSLREIKKNYGDFGPISRQIIIHHQNYCYQGYNWEGPVFKIDYFLKRLKEFVMSHDLDLEIRKKRDYHRRIKQKQSQYLKAIKLDKKHRELFNLTGDFIYSKDYRKDLLVKSYWQIDPLLAEIAKRLNLSTRQVRNLTLPELRELDAGKKITPDQRSRLKMVVYVILGGKKFGDILVKNDAAMIVNFLRDKEKIVKQVQVAGQVAYPGVIQGRVRIVEHPKDILNMKKGDILVAHMTNPDLVPGMKLAGAIVTETGGITCHAAIVSRELGKPCVIGTKIATRVFKDGDLVEVDATKGIVRKI